MHPLAGARPLSGLKIIEVGTGLAVGTAGMVLAELGAAITKILPPWGDVALAPGAAVAAVEAHVHSAKTVERWDLADRGCRRAFDDEIRPAAAIIVSGPMGFRRSFDLDYADVQAIRPDLTYCGLTGFGRSGPLADCPATEFDVQVVGGMTRQLGRLGDLPVRQGFHLVSVNTGFAAAQAVMAALLAPARPDELGRGGGRLRHLEVSLLRTALVLNGWNLTAESGHDGVDGKQMQAAAWPPDHGYTCRDRQVLISIRNNDTGWTKFLVALDRLDLLADERFSTLEQLRAHEWLLPRLLAETTGRFTSDELQAIVEEAGGQLVPVLEPWEVLAHPQAVVQGLAGPDGGVTLPIDVVTT